jgi:GNAT superfamily N-acetyltransferase
MTTLATERLAAIQPGDLAMLGVPWDAHSSFLRGAALAPTQIRATLHNGAMNLCAENGHDLGAEPRWHDLGDLAIPPGDAAALAAITGAAADVLARGGRLLALGGDHASSFPLLQAYGRAYPGLIVLHVDVLFRRQGVTGALIAHVEAAARAAGASGLVIITGFDNQGAQAVYRASGNADWALAMAKRFSKE